jgi:tight adherence protein B
MTALLASEDGPLILAIGLTILISAFIGLGMLIAMRGRARVRFKKRLAAVSMAGGGAGHAKIGKKGQQRRLLIQGKLDEIEEDRKKVDARVTLAKRLEMAGVSSTVKQFYIISIVVGVVIAVGVLALRIGPVPALLGGIGIGFGGPRMALSYMTSKRRGKFVEKFADAVDIIVRGIRSGLPLGECLSIIGRESPEPLAEEFLNITEGMRIGLTMNESMERAAERIGVPEFRFFTIVLSIQQETGGNLAETLTNLSSILRARKAMKNKVKAMSSEARTTAMIIGALPFGMAIILFLTSPEYIAVLFASSTGHLMMVGGVVSMSIGTAIMSKMIAFKI